MSNLPIGWTTIDLGECADWYSGGTPDTSNPAFWNGNIPWITASSLHNFYLNYSERQLTKSGLENGSRLMPENTIIFVVRGMSLKTEFRLGITRKPVAFGQDCKALVAKRGIDPWYLAYAIKSKSNDILGMVDEAGHGTGRLQTEVLKQIKIPIPPLHEQKRISLSIRLLDDKIELNHIMNRTLESMARSVFWEMMNDEDGRMNGWEEKTIGDVVTVVGGTTPSTSNSAFWDGGDIHWATPKDLAPLKSPFLLGTNSRITELGLKEISSGLLPVGTVLLSSRAPIGYLAITQIPVAINQGFIAIKCTEETPNYFMLNWVKENMEEIISRANGSTFLEISKSNFRPMNITIPPSKKMKTFVETVEPLYQKIVANLKESRTLASLRDSLLPKLMRGEVRVKDVEKEL